MNKYYDENTQLYIDATKNCDMEKHYTPFLKLLSSNAHILDAGCGSGRDSLSFLNRGYSVEAFDLSDSMVDAASSLTGIDVMKNNFLTLTYKNEFDAIWACASLLHVEREKLPLAFLNLHNALKEDGILYCSFKNREKDFVGNGRVFTCFNEDSFAIFNNEINLFNILSIYPSNDSRKGREKELWINCILRKKKQ